MSTELTYTAVPSSYLHCMSSHCPQANICLRAMAWSLVPKEQIRIEVVNPAAVTEAVGRPYYRDAVPVRYALGFKGMQAKMVLAQYDRFMMFLQASSASSEERENEPYLPRNKPSCGKPLLMPACLPIGGGYLQGGLLMVAIRQSSLLDTVVLSKEDCSLFSTGLKSF